jgi:hypothetical protein
MVYRNVGNYLAVGMALQPKGHETSASPVQELQILNTYILEQEEKRSY